MAIDKHIAYQDFLDELQHRIVKFGPRSKPAREAVRFARGHSDRRFLQAAQEKVDAQQRYLRDKFGPTYLERLSASLGLPGMAEIGLTLALVVAGCGLVELARGLFRTPQSDALANQEVEQLAAKLGFYIQQDPEAAKTAGQPESHVSARPAIPLEASEQRELLTANAEEFLNSPSFRIVLVSAIRDALADAYVVPHGAPESEAKNSSSSAVQGEVAEVRDDAVRASAMP